MSREVPRRIADHRRKVTDPQSRDIFALFKGVLSTHTPRISEGAQSYRDTKLTPRAVFSMKRSESHRALAESGRSVYAPRNAVQRSLPSLSRPSEGRSLFHSATHVDSVASITRVGSSTHTGSINGVEKPHNQDCSFTLEGAGWYLLGVCDGHGSNGHLVSNFLKGFFPKFVFDAVGSPDTAKIPDLASLALKYSYGKCARALQESKIDCSNSGSTCVTVLVHDSTLTCGNVGDSRAVLGRKTNGAWTAAALSTDHKPDQREEYSRIIKSGGEVSVSKIAHAGPARVYLRGAQFPGLAMSRSMGDEFAKSIGVTGEPDLVSVKLGRDDKFVILASDGVWEFLSNQDAVRIVAPFWDEGNALKASVALVQESLSRWKVVDSMVDDITAVVAFLSVA